MIKHTLYKTLRPLVSVKGVEQNLALVAHANLDELSQTFLSDLRQFVTNSNPYYAQLLQNSPELPPLTKALIQENFEKLQSQGLKIPTYKNSSGGSTGKPQTFVQDMQFSSWSETAQEYYYREFLGVEIAKVRKAVLWGSERDIFKERDIKGKATNWLTNTLFLNSFSIADEKWIEYAEAINRYKPQYIRGYAGSLYQFAKAVRKQNLKVTPPKFIISSAETLQDFMRTEIEEVLSAKVYNYYGSREVGAIAGECKAGHMHSFSFHNLLEVDTNGQFLVTNLHNYSMPLIRYQIGDVGELGKGTCSCGSPLPWISTLHGRITDHFRTAEGTIVHGEYFTHLFYYRDWVAEFQVNQKEMTYIEVLIVATAKVPQKDIDEINTKIQLVMGKNCQIEWKLVDSIAKTPQGKHLFTRSLLPQ